jgi:hypothetical protein
MFFLLKKILLSPDFWAFLLVVFLKVYKILIRNKKITMSLEETQSGDLTSAVSDLPQDDRKLQPLGLPRGSVRAVLTLLFTFFFLASFFFPEVQARIPEWVWACWTGLIGYYIGYRTDNTPVKKII